MSEFSVKIRGVRGSYPVADKRFLKYGGNTACVEINVNGNLIIIDAGTGLIGLGNELLQRYVESGTTLTDRTPVKATFLLAIFIRTTFRAFRSSDRYTFPHQ